MNQGLEKLTIRCHPERVEGCAKASSLLRQAQYDQRTGYNF